MTFRPLPSSLVLSLGFAVREEYTELAERLTGGDLPFHTYTLQYTFVFYLLLGQLLVLLLWRMVMRRRTGPASYRGRVAFALYLLAAQVALFAAWPYLVGAWQLLPHTAAADLVAVLHLGLIVGVLLGLVLVAVGWPFGWSWTRNFWLRAAQVVVIEVVVGQAIVGIECPLQTVERQLRGGPGKLRQVEDASAIGRWCNDLLYHPPNPPVFLVMYVSVGLLVLLTWVLIPPRFPWREPRGDEAEESPQRNEEAAQAVPGGNGAAVGRSEGITAAADRGSG